MISLDVINPFGAPVFFEERVASTMVVSRELAAQGCPHGTVIVADFQEAGRGRISERTWEAEKGTALMFTVLLRYAKPLPIPRGLTLRTGLAVSLAIEDFSPLLNGRIRIKWPNDVMADSRKLCGIIAVADGEAVHIGIGVNVSQKEFPPQLQNKAGSISLASGADIDPQARFALLEKILQRLYTELEASVTDGGDAAAWRGRVEARLYKNGERAAFAQGAADSGALIKGRLSGIGPDGELLLTPDGTDTPQAFFSGELVFV